MSVKALKVCKYFTNLNGLYKIYNVNLCRNSHVKAEPVLIDLVNKRSDAIVEKIKSENENNDDLNIWRSEHGPKEEGTSVTDIVHEDISHIAPYFQPTFNFAAYVNKSESLQELVKLGVDLHKLEKKKDVPNFLLQLNFESDMKAHIMFLHDLGVPPEDLGSYFTKNPYIFKEDLENLHIRVNYLQSKRFTDKMISLVIRKNPYWLLFSTEKIDRRLGHFQKTYKLTGKEVRGLTTKQPRLITYSLMHVRANTFTVKEEMGFSDDEMKKLLLKAPRLWMKCNKMLLATFDYVHNVMKLSHEQILDFPEILKSRIFRIKQRHMFLQTLGRAQYDPKLEGYVSPQRLVEGTDTEFCQSVAKSSAEAFNIFLKSV